MKNNQTLDVVPLNNDLDTILDDLDKKINELSHIYNDYTNMSLTEEFESFGQYEHEQKSIINVRNSLNKEKLNLFLNKKKEAIITASILGKHCILSQDPILILKKLFEYLDETYPEKNKHHEAFQFVYLESVLPSLKIMLEQEFLDILSLYENTRYETSEQIKLSHVHIKNALAFKMVLFNEAKLDLLRFQALDTEDFYSYFPDIINNAYNINPFNTHQFLIGNLFFKDILISEIFNQTDDIKTTIFKLNDYKQLALFYDIHILEGLVKCYDDLLANVIKNRVLSKEDLFYIVTTTNDNEFVALLKQQKDNNVKILLTLTKILVGDSIQEDNKELSPLPKTITLSSSKKIISYSLTDFAFIEKVPHKKASVEIQFLTQNNKPYETLVSQYQNLLKQLSLEPIGNNNTETISNNIIDSSLTLRTNNFINDFSTDLLNSFDHEEVKLLIGEINDF